MKIDVTKIEGYSEMSAEEKLAALESYTIPDPDYTGYVKKDAFDKAASEAAEWKRKHNALLSEEEQKRLIEKDSTYGNIICRCSSVSEGEILETIRRPLGARTLDAVKRRTGANMGRCQGGFCYPKVMEILSRELNIPMEDTQS